ncbi:MAG: four helix bundle protein [Gemmatimonadaceae bacterium]
MPTSGPQFPAGALAPAAVDFSVAVYRATRTFPPVERFCLTSQLRRAAVSTAANLTEGYARFGPRQLRAFAEIAYGSARGCDVLLTISHRVGYINDAELDALRYDLGLLAKRILGLLRSLRVR